LRGRALFLEFVCVENEKIDEEKQLATEEFSSNFFRERRSDHGAFKNDLDQKQSST